MAYSRGVIARIPEGMTLRSPARVLLVAATLLGCVGCDQASKSAARALLAPFTTRSLMHDALRLQLTENAGAFLSLGASLPEHLRFVLFTAATGALLVGLSCAALFARRLDRWKAVALALIAGGGASNLWDRLMDAGRVTDFLNVGIGPLRTGIFNFADMAILGGAILLVWGGRAVAASPPSSL